MPERIVILGGGTGGTLAANRLRRSRPRAEIVVVDRDDAHVYQPGLLLVPFGLAEPDGLVRSRRAQLHDGIGFRLGEVERVSLTDGEVELRDGGRLGYDVLVVASGCELQPGETEGLEGALQDKAAHTFYTLEGAARLRDALAGFRGGRLVVNFVDLPIKCPVAPLEFCFLADWYLQQRGVRNDVELTLVTPLDGAFTKPVASRHLEGLLKRKGIRLQTEFAAGSVDSRARQLISYDDRVVDFDLLVTIPLHGGAEFVEASPRLGDELGFVDTDRATLCSRGAPNVFAIGDAANLPASKAGSVAHFEGETLVENVGRCLDGRELTGSYDGHTNCFIETGFGRALLIDFSYDTEPLPGQYPEPHLGPLPLLRESRLNHLAKLGFEWLYWHMLLPGRDMPGVGSQFRTAGKRPQPIAN